MQLIQFMHDNAPRVGIVQGDNVQVIDEPLSMYELAQSAIIQQCPIQSVVEGQSTFHTTSYTQLAASGVILPPITHPDPAHLLVTGTGLTHLGSADARDRMHKVKTAEMTDSMRMFQLGLKGGKPSPGTVGIQPEWFYKGDGTQVAAPYQSLSIPHFALDGGEEPEIAGIYCVGPDGHPYRLGFALGNEFSDHVMEKQNYLNLAHSKLRPCSFGPELVLGNLPTDVHGCIRIIRDGMTLWEKPFLSGEENMSHTIANLEYHHFKYAGFRRPGDVHVHFFGTATLSFTDGIKLDAGDVVEITAEPYAHPLRNTIVREGWNSFEIKIL
jgi:hypothetical protein